MRQTAHPHPHPHPPDLELRVEHVTKRYGANTVVDDLSFTVQPGRVTGFLGPTARASRPR